MVYRPESLLERLELLRQYGADLTLSGGLISTERSGRLVWLNHAKAGWALLSVIRERTGWTMF